MNAYFFWIYIILIICLPIKKGKIKINQNIIKDYREKYSEVYMELKLDYNKYIKEINKSNFSIEILKYNYAMIIFYNENSEFSVDFMNAFSSMITEIKKEENTPFGFFKINEEINPELRIKYNKAMDNPLILIYKKGDIEIYKGPIDLFKIRRFLNRTIDGNIVNLYNINDIYKFQKKNNISFLYVSTVNINSTEYNFLKFFSDETFYFSDFINCISRECIKKFGNNTISIIERKSDNKNNITITTSKNKNIFNYENLKNFTINLGVENGGLLTELALQIIKSFKLTLILFFRNEINETTEKTFLEIKEKHKEYIFQKTKTKGSKFLEEIKIYFVVSDNELPTIQIYDSKKNENFQIKTKNLTKERIEEFIKDVKEGKIEREINSELPQEINNNQYISYIKIVGKNFKNLVLESEKPILVFFFMNNTLVCPNCVEALSTFVYLSHKYLIDYQFKSFQMGIIDVLNNEIQRNLKKVPFISFYNAPGNLSPIDFDGNATKDNYELFIAKTLGWVEIPKDLTNTYVYYDDE